MKSIERVFDDTKMNPFWSSYICFAESIKHRNFTSRIITKWFNRLVEKDDYFRADKQQILIFLETLTIQKTS